MAAAAMNVTLLRAGSLLGNRCNIKPLLEQRDHLRDLTAQPNFDGPRYGTALC